MKKCAAALLLFLLPLCCTASTHGPGVSPRATVAANGAGAAEVAEELRWMSADRPPGGWAYAQNHAFAETPCEPKAFRDRLAQAAAAQDEQARLDGVRTYLSSLGFAVEADGFPYPGLVTAQLTEYGSVPAPWGEARVSAVRFFGGGMYLYFIFVEKQTGWRLTDALEMDAWAVSEGNQDLPLLRHWAGKPGAWLETRTVGHGTGVYVDGRQWYNVFTRRFDLAYTLEGFDSTLVGEDWYFAGWKTDLGFTPEEISDALRYVTYEGLVKGPLDAPDSLGEEIDAAMTVHEFRYDGPTASYVRVREERLPLMSPGSVYASGFLRRRE